MSDVFFKWWHGLGDSALFAPALRLWQDRGHQITVDCTPDKQCLFEAAGVEVKAGATLPNNYWHPPHPGNPQMNDTWLSNKLAYNLSEPPMPQIGTPEELFPEYLKLPRLSLKKSLTKKSKSEVDEFLRGIDGPLVLVHSKGNTSSGEKNLDGHLETNLYKHVLDKTSATVLALDWDNRVGRLASKRFRHLTDDFRPVTLPELWYLLSEAWCLVGVDSGPLHLAEQWTDTPVLGLWTGHHPAHFSIPRKESTHLVTGVGGNRGNWNRYRRHSYNVIDVGDRHLGERIGQNVARILDGKVGRELVLEDMLDRVHTEHGQKYMDRDVTFRMVLDHLKGKETPQVVETGCIRQEDDWTAGFSTYILGMALDGKGKLDSVDLSATNCNFARKWTGSFDSVTVHESDSLKYLESYTGPKIDVVYLDSLDADQHGHAEHCLKEAELVLPHLADDGLVLIDDTFWQSGKWVGKGSKAIPFLVEKGFVIKYSGYQTLLGR